MRCKIFSAVSLRRHMTIACKCAKKRDSWAQYNIYIMPRVFNWKMPTCSAHRARITKSKGMICIYERNNCRFAFIMHFKRKKTTEANDYYTLFNARMAHYIQSHFCQLRIHTRVKLTISRRAEKRARVSECKKTATGGNDDDNARIMRKEQHF